MQLFFWLFWWWSIVCVVPKTKASRLNPHRILTWLKASNQTWTLDRLATTFWHQNHRSKLHSRLLAYQLAFRLVKLPNCIPTRLSLKTRNQSQLTKWLFTPNHSTHPLALLQRWNRRLPSLSPAQIYIQANLWLLSTLVPAKIYLRAENLSREIHESWLHSMHCIPTRILSFIHLLTW